MEAANRKIFPGSKMAGRFNTRRAQPYRLVGGNLHIGAQISAGSPGEALFRSAIPWKTHCKQILEALKGRLTKTVLV
jgi:hypothetical protein